MGGRRHANPETHSQHIAMLFDRSEIGTFPTGEHLAFSGIVLMPRQILVVVEEAFEAHQRSNEEPNVWRSVTVQLV